MTAADRPGDATPTCRRFGRRRFLGLAAAGGVAGAGGWVAKGGAAGAARVRWPTAANGAGFRPQTTTIDAGVWPEVAGAPARLAAAARLAFPLGSFGGELEYYRMAAPDVVTQLSRCAATGYTTIQTYVPWNVHEATQGVVDFTGRTHPVIVNDHVDRFTVEPATDQLQTGGAAAQVVANTDLAAFLEACAARDLQVVLRPGPFISDEWRNGGLPDWLLVGGYPEIFMRGPEDDAAAVEPELPLGGPVGIVAGGGPEFYFVGPSYASATYRSAVRRWLGASFASFVRPYLAPAGGPVVAVQVDDESCYYYNFGPFEVDYHPAMVAAFTGRFGRRPPVGWPAPSGDPRVLAEAVDWQRFKAEQIATFLGTCAADLRAGGVAGVPITHEIELQLAPPASPSADAAAVSLFSEFYNGDSGWWSLPVNELCAQAVRAAQRNAVPTMAAEMQPGDLLLSYLLLGEGLVGELQFTYTEGVPAGAEAGLALLARTLGTAGGRWAEAQRHADLALVWNPEAAYLPYGTQHYGLPYDARRAFDRDLPALAALAVRAGYSFDLVDVTAATAADYRRYPTLLLAGAATLPAAAQQALVEHVRGGGRLVCYPAPPLLDERGSPCTVLAEQLFDVPLGRELAGDHTIDLLGVTVPVWRAVQTYRPGPTDEVVATVAGLPCGYLRQAGQGQALLLGSWLAADSVAGREGTILAVQALPAGTGRAAAVAAAMAMATRSMSPAAAAAVGGSPAWDAGPFEALLVFYYSNQRRAGEVITAACLAGWDGHNVVGIVEEDTAFGDAGVHVPPYRPILPAHLAAMARLVGRAPAIEVVGTPVQARLLRGTGRTATVCVANRSRSAASTVLRLDVPGAALRLPMVGELQVPATSGMLLPVGYGLGDGLVLAQASAQLVAAQVHTGRALLTFAAPSDGEAVLLVAGPAVHVTVDGRPVPAVPVRWAGQRAWRVVLPPGQPVLGATW